MASSVLISGWGNGGWGQTSWGTDALQMSVDGSQASTDVGSAQVLFSVAVQIVGDQVDVSLGETIASLGTAVLVNGVELLTHVGAVNVREETEVIVILQGMQMAIGLGTLLVWTPVDDSQATDWQPVDDTQTPAWQELIY